MVRKEKSSKPLKAPSVFETGGRKTKAVLVALFLTLVFNTIESAMIVSNGKVPVTQTRSGGSTGYGMLSQVTQYIYLVVAITFALWFFRAYKNLITFSNKGLKFSPTWALVGYLLPPLNFVLPYFIAREIWKGSDPDADAADPTSWRQSHSPPYILLWWIFTVASAILTGVAITMIILEKHEQETVFTVLANGSLIVTAALGMWIVSNIDKRQQAKHALLEPDSSIT
jgi:hypothetical protein